MKHVVLGGAGFIGTNLALALSKNIQDEIIAVDKELSYFSHISKQGIDNIRFVARDIIGEDRFDDLLDGCDVLYHLISTTIPSTSNRQIEKEFHDNISTTLRILDSCVKMNVKKVVFLSSGGTVYGKDVNCPISEESQTNPISSYGIQKLTIEKILYLYNYLHGLDYRIVRLANPYGPYQKPNGVQGVVTTFIDRVINDQQIAVYGDGSVVRDFIYINDAVEGIINIVNVSSEYKLYNLGSGRGVSIKELIEVIEKTLNKKANVLYEEGRNEDVKENYLDISRYHMVFGVLNHTSLEEGIMKTAAFLRNGK